MQLTYYLDDGYAGKRPRHVNIPDDEIDECENEQQYNDLIESIVQQDFEQNVTFYYNAPKFIKKQNQNNE